MSSKLINFTNRDFSSLKEAALQYAKQFYPETYKDFGEASFGALLIDLMCLMGDSLSFQLDFQANEVFMENAQQIENIMKLARERGYRDTGKPSANGVVDFYIIVPANNSFQPNADYIPILKKNSSFSVTQTGAGYLLTEDVDFADDSVVSVVATVDNDGQPTSFALKSSGKVVSGALYTQKATITTFENFIKIKLDNPLMTEVISVFDTNGNEYYQVEYLTQDVVYKFVKNTSSDSATTPYKLAKFYVPRRFVIEYVDGFYYLVFGSGSTDSITDPRNLVLNFDSRTYISDKLIDPKNIIQSDKFGIAPTDTTLSITYRANNSRKMGAGARSLTKVMSPIFKFPSTATNGSSINSIRGSLEVENILPISNVNQAITTDELKTRAFAAYGAQGRAVSKDDYIYMVYSMPPQAGSVKRANIMQDSNSFKKNLNLYVMGEDADGNLTEVSTTTKENLKIWLQSKKMINDTIDILDAQIINVGIRFIADTDLQDKDSVLIKCIEALKNKYQEKFDIGQSFSLSEVYKTLNLIPEITDCKSVKLFLQNGANYASSNFDINSNISADGSHVFCPERSIFEVKFGNIDIIGTIV